MQRKILEKPIISNKKVYIIDDSDTMTKEAQNCLLKTLEEPPEFIVIILIGRNENMYLNTIKSRCMQIHFENIEKNILLKYLKENNIIENPTKYMIKFINGSIKNAIEINKNKEIYQKIEEIFTNIEKKNLVSAIKELEIIYKNKELIYNILEYIDVIFYSKVNENSIYVRYINLIEETKNRIQRNNNYDMCIDYLIFNIWKEN